MVPRIEKLKEKKLVGHHIKMSLIQNKTGLLWKSFAPKIKEIQNKVSQDKISMQIYPANYYKDFSPGNEFEKWATVEVEDFESVPDGMNSFNLEGGLYAVFDYKGSSTDTSIFEYIFREWLPASDFQIDDRPHFEVLGENYKNNDPDSEEEIWIPVKEKS
ncbi:GyrI-like domain-containing protein [Flagellimonas nanhaiensis]|uniref:AraC family transcriptional regulator n=1 Tax=Flagellimonas nanhaiensis TaxID=2292706 RepID=A0A371JNA8_9FLAO|nr:GyrI-like domain-containing protein [Allomuricauda nanhaiensis]RDY58713.1 AraC family transcriptional regulator [Allomuricauda nanhaiensis]